MTAKATKAEIKEQLSRLEGWTVKDGHLEKEFKFEDFPAAMQFMNALAPVAEKLNHHPVWSNSYNKVFISLTTHSENGLTAKDFSFAASANSVYKLS